MDLSRDARLAFIGLWNFCDDAGIHPAKLKTLKAEVFPADDLTGDDVRRMVDECIAVGLVDEYDVDGEFYWLVTGWHHQKIEKPSFKHPTPDGTYPDGAAKRRQTRMKAQKSSTVHGAVGDESARDGRVVAEPSPPERSGEEWNGEEWSKEVPGSAEDARARGREGTPPSADRAVDIAVYLRRRGVIGANSANPNIAAWADDLRVTTEILDAGLSVVASRNLSKAIGPNYLAPIIGDLLNPKASAKARGARQREQPSRQETLERRNREVAEQIAREYQDANH
ncbi:hypothetical protein AWB76_03262 [Caballeronia temeraria]|uniref:Gp60 n=1 Tax=Caballeronia temeraria TaxID=1777137 RepID=A0A158AXU2_9BURK|nr:hypothetical protein [Caballeronia temeraria]SAK62529.1 hypothetical protein AWB76_03262 [Caballeronia temeraria]